MALYETVFVTRQDLTVDDVDNLSDKLSKIVTERNGKIVSKEYWGLKNLAYKIKKNSRGHYVLLNINSDFDAIAEVKRVMGFDENIIRSAIFKVENHSKTPSQLMISVEAKDYKSGKNAGAHTSEIDAVIDQIVINN